LLIRRVQPHRLNSYVMSSSSSSSPEATGSLVLLPEDGTRPLANSFFDTLHADCSIPINEEDIFSHEALVDVQPLVKVRHTKHSVFLILTDACLGQVLQHKQHCVRTLARRHREMAHDPPHRSSSAKYCLHGRAGLRHPTSLWFFQFS